MKKTFYQTSISFQIITFITFLLPALGLTIFIVHDTINALKFGLPDNAKELKEFKEYFIKSLFCILFCLYLFINYEHNNIHIKKGKIYMYGDWKLKIQRNKIQFYAEINIADIKSIDIIWRRKNSKGKPLSIPRGGPTLQPYISFKKNNNNRRVYMWIYNMHYKTVEKMINYIKAEMIKYNNFNEIEDTATLVEKFRKPYRSKCKK